MSPTGIRTVPVNRLTVVITAIANISSTMNRRFRLMSYGGLFQQTIEYGLVVGLHQLGMEDGYQVFKQHIGLYG